MRPSSKNLVGVPARERVADRLGDGRFAGDDSELGFKPGTQRVDDWPGAQLSHTPALVDTGAANVGLDGIERDDAHERLAGDRRGCRSLDLVEAPSHMAPAEGKLDLAALGELGIGAVAVDLQRAVETCKMLGRPRMLAVGRVDIGDAGRLGAGSGPLVAGIGRVGM
jgi:hypothetical protein